MPWAISSLGQFRIAIVQNADSASVFDDLDAALQRGSAVPRQITILFLNGREASTRSAQYSLPVF
jgi:hypothetical protein